MGVGQPTGIERLGLQLPLTRVERRQADVGRGKGSNHQLSRQQGSAGRGQQLLAREGCSEERENRYVGDTCNGCRRRGVSETIFQRAIYKSRKDGDYAEKLRKSLPFRQGVVTGRSGHASQLLRITTKKVQPFEKTSACESCLKKSSVPEAVAVRSTSLSHRHRRPAAPGEGRGQIGTEPGTEQ